MSRDVRKEVGHMHAIREAELEIALARAGLDLSDKRVLEIGSGTGAQLVRIAELAREAVGIDLPTSSYHAVRVAPIVDYDGRNIPFGDGSFDVVFSSNVLEHVAWLDEFEAEMKRVLVPGGYAIHIVPSHHWRLWTHLAHYPKLPVLAANMARRRIGTPPAPPAPETPRPAPGAKPRRPVFMAARHGERGNRLTEWWYFHPRWWRGHFGEHGWEVLAVYPAGVFYTGYELLGSALPIGARRRLASVLGAAAYVFVLRKGAEASGE